MWMNTKLISLLILIELKQASEGGHFSSNLGHLECKSKVYSLIPFLVEAKFTPKNFVTKMQLYPEGKVLEFEVLGFGGLEKIRLPIDNVIPVTKFDYWSAAGYMPFFKQNQTFDLDMVYANRVTKEMFVFDKEGEWHDDGVYHEALNMDNTYNETNWYDEFSPDRF